MIFFDQFKFPTIKFGKCFVEFMTLIALLKKSPNPLKSSSSEPYVLLDHRRIKVYKVYINDDPGLTLTYFPARSNLVEIAY